MIMKRYYYILLASFLILLTFSCKKGLLDDKPDKSLLVPESLSDFQSLLDNLNVMNVTPALQNIAADDYYTTDSGWLALITEMEKNSYIWAPAIYENMSDPDWDFPYQQVFYANVVLDGLNNLKQDTATANTYNQIKGSALFYRAYAEYNLALMFADDYDPATAAQEPGIPIRLSSDVNIKSTRGTLAQTYQAIINDLNAAKGLLNVTAAYKSRPCKTAVLALLAKVYLSMGNYSQAQAYASACLKLNGALIDYNTLSTSASKPFPSPLRSVNAEVIYYSSLNAFSFNRAATTLVDTNLYSEYDDNDLRKSIFFKQTSAGYTFKGTYNGDVSFFTGLSTDETYLIKAECEARQNDIQDALSDLNTLLVNRYLTGTYVNYSTTNISELLGKIVLERRKELVGRGIRWYDLKRLNKEPAFATTLTHIIQGQTYVLQPNAELYVFPIPDDELASDGLAQNPR
jgi:hypothetical protein